MADAGENMKLYLVRHGETEWNQRGLFQGTTDIPLNQSGRDQAAAAALALRDIPFDAAFCSPLSRARETARIIMGGRGVPVTPDERLREISFGAGEGRSVPETRRSPGTPLYDFLCAPERYVPPEGGEPLASLFARTGDFVREVLFPLEGTCESVLVAAHGAVNRAILNPALGLSAAQFWQVQLTNCAVSVLEVEGGRLRVVEPLLTYI